MTLEIYMAEDMRFEKLKVTEYSAILLHNYLIPGNFLRK